MQKIVKFRVADSDIAEQIEDYMSDNSTHELISLTSVHNGGEELVLVLVDDGQ